MKKPNKQADLILGPLPVAIINRTIGTELEEGPVVFSRAAQIHAFKRHPEDYIAGLPHLGSIIASPLYVGDDHRNPGKIELIGRVLSISGFILVAVRLDQDEAGRYAVASFYAISEKKIQSRKQRGFLKIARKI